MHLPTRPPVPLMPPICSRESVTIHVYITDFYTIHYESYIKTYINTNFLMEQDTIEEIQEKADRFESQYNKLKQDFKDYIKSSKQNEANQKKEIRKEISKSLLTAADSLNRIVELDNNNSCELMKQYSDNTRKNIEIVYQQMLSAVELSTIEPGSGVEFDEQKHTAVELEYGTAYPENTIYKVIRKGYILENDIVRPAEVIVMKNPSRQKPTKSGILNRILGWIKTKNSNYEENKKDQ